MCFVPATVNAQESPAVPSTATEAQGFVAEPQFITRAVIFADRHLGKGDLTNGIYVDYGGMIPGAGWASGGPGYKHWYANDSVFVDASAAISVTGYKVGRATLELPRFLKSRLALGVHAQWQDFGEIDYFGVGSDSSLDNFTVYGVESTQLTAHATLRPFRWMDIRGQVGWMSPDVTLTDGRRLPAIDEKRTYVPTEVSMTIDTRDFAGHPTSGVVLRGVAARYDERSRGLTSFNRYEAEAAGFLPLAGSRVVLATHGWVVQSDTKDGQFVPFFLQPSLGGVNTLRSYTDYRFHDDNMVVANIEARIAMMTHLDFALFADAGNVARRVEDLNLDKRSYGVGLRLHTRRETFAMMDVATGDEGWKVLVRMYDPWRLLRVNSKPTLAPFVP